MDWRKIGKALGALALTVVGWFLAPIIASLVNGTPVNWLRGTWAFWKGVIILPIPAWAVVLILGVVVALIVVISRWRKHRSDKTDLRIVVLPTPSPRWAVGAFGDVPVLNLTVHANLAHRSADSLKIVSGYLRGTVCEAPFFPLVVAGQYDESQMIHFGVRPIIAKEGHKLSRSMVLVDQFGHKHTTEPIVFLPTPVTSRSTIGDALANCFFCHQPVQPQDLFNGAALPAHRNCIR